MQHKLNQVHNLLDENGHVIEAGWANEPLLHYRREDVKVDHNRLKEWDYYLIANENYGIAFSIANVGESSRLTANFMNYQTGEQYTDSEMVPSNPDLLAMPENPYETIKFETGRVKGTYIRDGYKTRIQVTFRDFFGKDLIADIDLDLPKSDAMVIVIPFDEGKEMFYYNYKLNCIKPKGICRYGDTEVEFSHETSFCVFDWGRGIWPNSNTWYWGSGSGIVDGNDFGFNIGYGFGNLDAASENMLFFNGKSHKLEEITFHIPENSFMEPWKFTSSDGRFEMDFVPVLDRSSSVKKGNYSSSQHQVFGKFTGTAILDEGTEIYLKDFFAFAEEVSNSWQ